MVKLIIGQKIKPELIKNKYQLSLKWNADDEFRWHFFSEDANDEVLLKEVCKVLIRSQRLIDVGEHKKLKELMKEVTQFNTNLVPNPKPFTSLQLLDWNIVYYDYNGDRFNVVLEYE